VRTRFHGNPFGQYSEQTTKVLDCRNGRRSQARAADRRQHPRGTQAGAVRRREAFPATVAAISDAVRWAEEIMDEIDRHHPAKAAVESQNK
jgi:hypothetical protein